MKTKRIVGALCLLAAAGLLVAAYLYQTGRLTLPPTEKTPDQPATPSASAPGEEPAVVSPAITFDQPGADGADTDERLSEENGDVLTAADFNVSDERKAYRDGELQLIIPTLEIDTPVLDGTTSNTLLRGVGLYDYSQLPGEGDRNVSIASHRNGVRNGVVTRGDPFYFYYADTLGAGDCLYLRDAEYIYQYTWKDTSVVTPDNWWPIYYQGFPCLTLTTCTPLGISDHRMIVRAELYEIHPYSAEFDYPAQIEVVEFPV